MSNTTKYGKDDLHPKKADVWKYMKYSYKTQFLYPSITAVSTTADSLLEQFLG